MKKEYFTPKIRIVKMKSESLMIQFSLGEGDDDEDEAGAKRFTGIIIDDEEEDEEY